MPVSGKVILRGAGACVATKALASCSAKFPSTVSIRPCFPRSTLDKLLDAALGACDTLFALQREALESPYPGVLPEGPAPKKAFGS